MKYIDLFCGLGWSMIAISILRNMVKWWSYNVPDGTAFCSALACSGFFFFSFAKEL